MSIDSLKFTEVDGSIATDIAVAGHLIAELENRPAEDDPPLNAAQLKQAFDYLSIRVLGPRLNALIDGLMAADDGDAGADNIGATTISGLTGATVQAILEDLKTQLDGVSQGAIPDNSLADAKLSDGSANILARFAAHVLNFATHFRYLGTTGGTSTAYTATDNEFAFDTANVNLLAIRAHANCGANPTLTINSGTARTLKPNAAATLSAGQMKANGVYLLLWHNTTPATMYILNPETITLDLTIANVTGLDTALAGKASAGHGHPQSSITNLEAALAGKALSSHSHEQSDVTGLETALGGKAPLSHIHEQSGVTGLVTALAGKSDTSHNHNSAYLGISATAANSTKVNNFKVFVQAGTPTATGTGDIWIQT